MATKKNPNAPSPVQQTFRRRTGKVPKFKGQLERDLELPADFDPRMEIPPNPSELAQVAKHAPRKRRTGLVLDVNQHGPLRFVLRDVESTTLKNGDLKVTGVAIDDGFVDPVTGSADGRREFSIKLAAAKVRGKNRAELGAVIARAVEDALPRQGGAA